ncbi:MAG: flagellar basal body P-ring formation protein FlgA [Gammaproteobacteria bacterium]|nr:flagellar basal body P-ring formation protein FlgA [Gammaproteobacteria bacterium]
MLIANLLCFIVLMSVQMSLAFASAYQSHKSIYYAARNYVNTQVIDNNGSKAKVIIGKLDSRLKLKRCSKYLRAFMPKGSRKLGKTTIGVKCDGVIPWSLHVPVTISKYIKVLVATHQLQKGSVLKISDIQLKSFDIATLPYGFIEDIKSGTGMKLKRRVLTGAVLTPAMLKKPQIISRGQQVTILAQTGLMAVRMNGKALANGAIGDRIKVINLKSRKKLEGIITMAGEVKVKI